MIFNIMYTSNYPIIRYYRQNVGHFSNFKKYSEMVKLATLFFSTGIALIPDNMSHTKKKCSRFKKVAGIKQIETDICYCKQIQIEWYPI